jgi:hypothetical protein
VEPDEIVMTCERSSAAEWVYWTYAPPLRAGALGLSPKAATSGRALHHYAQATYLQDVAIGIAWGEVREVEATPQAWPPELASSVCGHRWIDLLHGRLVVERFLALAVEDGSALLPAPTVQRGSSGHMGLSVERREFAVVRLANEIDPSCSGFERCFRRSGIGLR